MYKQWWNVGLNTIQYNNKNNNKEYREQPGERKSNYNLNKVVQNKIKNIKFVND